MRPNFLFIVADDLNAWIGALGRHPQVQTPNIDALARRGVLFERAYCSAPYCNASRMGFFTGQLPTTNGIFNNEPFWDQPNRAPTFIELLRAAGYHTMGAGKVFHGAFNYKEAGAEKLETAPWVEAQNNLAVWDRFHTTADEPLPPSRPLNGLFDFERFDDVPMMYHLFDWGPLPAHREQDAPDAHTVAAISDFLREPQGQPFFCAAGLYKPHLPWHAPQRFFDLYAGDVALPLVRDDDLDDVPPTARKWALSPPDHELVTSRGVWPDAVRAYLACISYADHMVGQIIAALDASGHAHNTAIILCGDNGFHLGEKLHWRKFALWEESTRVPLIYVPPSGLAAPKRVAEPTSLLDIFPSVLEAANVAHESAIDGESFLPRFDGAARARPVISTWGDGNHSLRTARWRYTLYADGGRELYDHAADPYEWTNLAEATEFAPIRVELEAQLRTHAGARLSA